MNKLITRQLDIIQDINGVRKLIIQRYRRISTNSFCASLFWSYMVWQKTPIKLKDEGQGRIELNNFE